MKNYLIYLFIVIVITSIGSYTKETYPIIEHDGGYILVERKGKYITLYDPLNLQRKTKDSITFYFDRDFTWDQLSHEEPIIKKGFFNN